MKCQVGGSNFWRNGRQSFCKQRNRYIGAYVYICSGMPATVISYGVMKKKEIYTDEQRTYILKKFVQTFLPKVPKYHRNMANELHHVSTTTTRLMKRLFGLHTDFAEMSAIFQSMGYAFFTREGVYNPTTQRVTVMRRGSLFAKGTEIEEPDVDFLYVNVNAQTVRMLRLCTIPTPPNTSEDKVDDLDYMKQLVEKFQKRIIAETQTPLFLDVEKE